MIRNLPAGEGDARDAGSIPRSGMSPGGADGNPLQYSCLENRNGQRSLAGYSPWGHKESDTTEHIRTQCPRTKGRSHIQGFLQLLTAWPQKLHSVALAGSAQNEAGRRACVEQSVLLDRPSLEPSHCGVAASKHSLLFLRL